VSARNRTGHDKTSRNSRKPEPYKKYKNLPIVSQGLRLHGGGRLRRRGHTSSPMRPWLPERSDNRARSGKPPPGGASRGRGRCRNRDGKNTAVSCCAAIAASGSRFAAFNFSFPFF